MSKSFLGCKGIVLSVALMLSLSVKEAAFAHIPHDTIEELEISPTYPQDKTLFITIRNNLLRSKDGGASWQRIVKGLDNYSATISSFTFPPGNNSVFLSSRGAGIYKSQDNGSSWFKVNNGLNNLYVDLLDASGSEVVFAAASTATKNGLYKTKNGGKNWYQVINSKSRITAINSSSNSEYKFIGDARGVLYLSTDGGEVWRQRFQILNSGAIKSIAISPNFSVDKTFFVGTSTGGVFKTVNGGASFSAVNTGISDKRIISLALSPNYRNDGTVFASTWGQAVFRSNNNGNTWQRLNRGTSTDIQADQFKVPQFIDLRISPTFAADKTLFLAGFDGLFKSTNGGLVWKQINTTPESVIVGLALSPNYKNDKTLAVSTYVGGFFKTINQGITWALTNKGLEGRRLGDLVFSPNYSVDNTIIMPTYDFLLKSTNRGSSWRRIRCGGEASPTSDPTGIPTLAPTRIVISPNFAADKTIYFGTLRGRLFRSTNGGESCSVILVKQGKEISSLAISPNFATEKIVYASFNEQGVYKTLDGGNTWQPVSNGITDKTAMELAISPNHKVDKTVFVGTTAGLFKTTNGGQNWVKLSSAAYGGNGWVETVAVSPNYQNDRTVLIHVQGKGLFKSVNGGQSFVQVAKNLINNNHALATYYGFPSASAPIQFSPSYSVDKTIYGTSAQELFRSTDRGNTWEIVNIQKREVVNGN